MSNQTPTPSAASLHGVTKFLLLFLFFFKQVFGEVAKWNSNSPTGLTAKLITELRDENEENKKGNELTSKLITTLIKEEKEKRTQGKFIIQNNPEEFYHSQAQETLPAQEVTAPSSLRGSTSSPQQQETQGTFEHGSRTKKQIRENDTGAVRVDLVAVSGGTAFRSYDNNTNAAIDSSNSSIESKDNNRSQNDESNYQEDDRWSQIPFIYPHEIQAQVIAEFVNRTPHPIKIFSLTSISNGVELPHAMHFPLTKKAIGSGKSVRLLIKDAPQPLSSLDPLAQAPVQSRRQLDEKQELQRLPQLQQQPHQSQQQPLQQQRLRRQPQHNQREQQLVLVAYDGYGNNLKAWKLDRTMVEEGDLTFVVP